MTTVFSARGKSGLLVSATHFPHVVRPFGAQIDDDAVAFRLDPSERGGEVAVRRVRLVSEHVPEEVPPMHPDQRGLIGPHGMARRIEPPHVAHAKGQVG